MAYFRHYKQLFIPKEQQVIQIFQGKVMKSIFMFSTSFALFFHCTLVTKCYNNEINLNLVGFGLDRLHAETTFFLLSLRVKTFQVLFLIFQEGLNCCYKCCKTTKSLFKREK